MSLPFTTRAHGARRLLRALPLRGRDRVLWGAFAAIFSSLIALPAQAGTCAPANLRWASSSNIIYITGEVACTLTDIQTFLPAAPLVLADPTNHIWLLKANLKLEQGATLNLHGSAIGGDADELRLKSNNASLSNSTIWIRAQWGTVDMKNTRVTSWDEAANGPDTEYQTYLRSYVHVRSYLESDGVTARESRMNIADSDVGYLGFNGSEAYGLAWKVIGSQTGLFDKVNVYGTVTNSHIHHNYFGAYTFGAFGMEWRTNEIDHNVQYGLDPHDDSDSLIIESNLFHDNGNHGMICSQRCDHLTIRNNISRKNVGNGIMLHRNVNDSLVEGNQALENGDTGIAVFDSHRNTIRGNTLLRNAHGVRLSVGSSENLVENNDVGESTVFGLYFYKGSDVPTSGDGHPKQNRFIQNNVHDNTGGAIQLADADDNIFDSNVFARNGTVFALTRGIKNLFTGNILEAGIPVSLKGSSTSRLVTYFTRQPLVRVQLDDSNTATFSDTAGFIFDPEETNLSTTVSAPGTTLTFAKSLTLTFTSNVSLTKAATAGSSLVTARALQAAVPSGGSAAMNITLWETAGAQRKQWETKASSSSLKVSHTVGDLKPNTAHVVKKNGSVLKKLTSDASGTIRFADTAGSTSAVTYLVKPAGT